MTESDKALEELEKYLSRIYHPPYFTMIEHTDIMNRVKSAIAAKDKEHREEIKRIAREVIDIISIEYDLQMTIHGENNRFSKLTNASVKEIKKR